MIFEEQGGQGDRAKTRYFQEGTKPGEGKVVKADG